MKKIFTEFVCILLFTLSLTAQRVQNKDPKVVAQKIYQYWHLKDKKSALKIADKVAVDKLFSLKWRPMKLKSFKRREEGGFECIYRDVKNNWTMAMTIEGGVSAGGYNVSELHFSGEE